MIIDKNPFTWPTVSVVDDWRPRPAPRRARRTETPSRTTAKRWRARARRRWPTYMPDVAYAIEGVPQPKRQHGRTWADFDRDEFLAGITLGVPPWYREAWRPSSHDIAFHFAVRLIGRLTSVPAEDRARPPGVTCGSSVPCRLHTP